MKNLSEKNILIIGASRGIGLSLARHISQLKDGIPKLFTVSRNLSQELRELNTTHLSADITTDSIENWQELPDRLDGFVYCPGAISLRPFARISPDSFLKDYELQVLGAIKSLQAVLPRLKKAEASSVVLFSTVAVQMGFSFHSQVAASKGAIEGLVRALAAELAPGIRVNGIAPSLTDTPLASFLLGSDEKRLANAQRHPLQRIGQPEDMARMAAFLLSDESSWITGQIMPVDGGMSRLRS